jgi:hypothetical protein
LKATYNNENRHNDGDAFDPIYRGLSWFPAWTEILKETQSQRDGGSN